MWLIATTITLFIANVRVMVCEYSGQFYIGIRYSPPVTQLLKWPTLILIFGKTPHIVYSKFTYSDTCELFGKSLQQKPRHQQEVVCFFQAKCPALMFDRSQTYISCTTWQCGTWCAVSGNFLRRKPKYTWERTFISTNTAFDNLLIAWSPDCQSVCGATYEFIAWIKKQ